MNKWLRTNPRTPDPSVIRASCWSCPYPASMVLGAGKGSTLGAVASTEQTGKVSSALCFHVSHHTADNVFCQRPCVHYHARDSEQVRSSLKASALGLKGQHTLAREFLPSISTPYLQRGNWSYSVKVARWAPRVLIHACYPNTSEAEAGGRP